VNLMNIRTLTAAFAVAALFGLTAAPAPAQTAAPEVAPPPADAQATPSKPKPKPKANTAGAPPVTVTVTNSRKADLVWLLAAEPGSANWTTVLGVVKAGKKTSTKLSQASNCHVDLQGRFADGKSIDASGFNVCADKTLHLID
jgi:hypothetical protein